MDTDLLPNISQLLLNYQVWEQKFNLRNNIKIYKLGYRENISKQRLQPYSKFEVFLIPIKKRHELFPVKRETKNTRREKWINMQTLKTL